MARGTRFLARQHDCDTIGLAPDATFGNTGQSHSERDLALALASFLLARAYKLAPPTNRVRRHRDIAVPMDDGVTLATDHFEPLGKAPAPTILLRTPYGRRGFAVIAYAYARRGYHVLVQSCRGTEKSGGTFEPLVNERADGLATIAWLKQQAWFDGRLGTSGPSYLGYCQWAISDAPEVAAMAIKVSSAEFRSVVFPAEAFHLGLWLNWVQTVEGLKDGRWSVLRSILFGAFEKRSEAAARVLPLIEADITVAGTKVPFWRHWFENALEDGPFWHAIDHRPRIDPQTPPVHLLSGWYDFMIEQLLADYAALVAAGNQPYLTISSSTHISGGNEADNPFDTLAWMDAFLKGDRSRLRKHPVRLEISGIGKWHEGPVFPPAGAKPQTLHLAAPGALSPEAPSPAPPSRYRYDPADPTPNLGGAIFAFSNTGALDNAPREARADVLTFTTDPLAEPVTIIGNCRLRLHALTSLPHADFFVRLCDVDLKGVSINICDGFLRTTQATARRLDGSIVLDITLQATAHCFAEGHRLRLQVSSGAHPRYARNLGSDEPIGTAQAMVPVDIEILHDPNHPSALTLPTYPDLPLVGA